MSLNNLLKLKPYELNRKNKKKLFEKQITMLTKFHYNNCKPYRKILNNLDFKIKNKNNIESFPMIPTQMFKKFDLKSVSSNEVIKKLVSSGTSTQKKSKVYLDKTNAKNQIKVLGKIMQAILGEKLLKMRQNQANQAEPVAKLWEVVRHFQSSL